MPAVVSPAIVGHRAWLAVRLLVVIATMGYFSLTSTSLTHGQDSTIPFSDPWAFESGIGDGLTDFAPSRLAELLEPDSPVYIEAVYFSDLLSNTRGGISTRNATRYLGLLDIGVTIDLERTHCPLPGRIHVLGQTTHGQGLTDRFVGDSLVLSDIDPSRNLTQLGGFWWEFGFLDEGVRFRVGKQDVNTEFVYMETAQHFVQSSFELTPNSALPTYPQQSLAVVSLMDLSPSLQFKLGIWDALAVPGTWGFSGNDTVFLVAELEYRYTLGPDQLPGTCSISGGHLTSGEFAGQPLDRSHGFAFQWEQVLFREESHELQDMQGLSMFVAYYPRFFGVDRLEEAIGDSAASGLVYTGLLPMREHDVIGVGVSWAELFQGGTNQETAIEVFYRAEITPRVRLQPDLQYIVTPSGIHPDALVLGLRFQLEL